MDEICTDFEHHVERPRTERERTLARQDVKNARGGRRPEDSVADRFGNAPVMAFHVAHWSLIVLYLMEITVIDHGRAAGTSVGVMDLIRTSRARVSSV